MFVKLQALLSKFRSDESGVTAIEYGLIAVGVGVAISSIVFTVGDDLVAMFTDVSAKLNPP